MDLLIGILLLLGILILLGIYPWLALIFVMTAIQFKLAAMYYIPIFRKFDFTVFSLILAAYAAIVAYIRRAYVSGGLQIPKTPVWCLTILAVLMWVGMVWTSAPAYGWHKTIRFTGICVPLVLLPSFFVRTPKDAIRVSKIAIITGVLTAVVLIAFPDSRVTELKYGGTYGRASGLGGSGNMMAELLGMGILYACLVVIIRGSLSRFYRYLAIPVLLLSLYALVLTGTRAGMLGLMATAPLLPLFAKSGNRIKAFTIVLLVVPLALLLIFVILPYTPWAHLVTRWEGFFEGDWGGGGATFGSRQHHFMFVMKSWWSRPILGHGPGSFAMDCFSLDQPMWPHNILLEALYEQGLVGAILITIALFSTFRLGIHGLKEAIGPQEQLIVAGPLMTLAFVTISALVHFPIDGTRVLYLFIGILYADVMLIRTAHAEGHLLSSQPDDLYLPTQTRPVWS